MSDTATNNEQAEATTQPTPPVSTETDAYKGVSDVNRRRAAEARDLVVKLGQAYLKSPVHTLLHSLARILCDIRGGCTVSNDKGTTIDYEGRSGEYRFALNLIFDGLDDSEIGKQFIADNGESTLFSTWCKAQIAYYIEKEKLARGWIPETKMQKKRRLDNDATLYAELVRKAKEAEGGLSTDEQTEAQRLAQSLKDGGREFFNIPDVTTGGKVPTTKVTTTEGGKVDRATKPTDADAIITEMATEMAEWMSSQTSESGMAAYVTERMALADSLLLTANRLMSMVGDATLPWNDVEKSSVIDNLTSAGKVIANAVKAVRAVKVAEAATK